MKSRLLGAVCACAVMMVNASNATAEIVIIDFNDLAPGTPVTNQYQSQGVTLSLIDSPLAGPYTYALVDNGTPLDIFGANGNAINPGDDTVPPYWAIEFNFSTSIDYFSIVVLDAEESFTITAYQGQQVVSVPTSTTLLGIKTDSPFRGPVLQVDMGEVTGSQLFDRVVISPNGDIPEVFDNLVFNTAILPTVIDIKPGSNTNPVNPRSKGKVPVAILTTDDFDASTVDASTVRFGPGEAEPVSYALEDVDGDMVWDLVLHFNTQETGIACGDTEASLTGEALEGVQITGRDSIETVGCGKQ